MRYQYIGVKLSHDGAVVAIDQQGNLRYCYEAEKNDNQPRHERYKTLEAIEQQIGHVLNDDFNLVALDGWDSRTHCFPKLAMPPYDETHLAHGADGDPMQHTPFNYYDETTDRQHSFRGFNHVTNHIMSAYMFSPYAGQTCNVLVWDGGVKPRLYRVSPAGNVIYFLGELFQFTGGIFSMLGYYYGPYVRQDVIDMKINPALVTDKLFGTFHAPGKLMSYAGLGTVNNLLYALMDDIYRSLNFVNVKKGEAEHNFYRQLKAHTADLDDATVVATVQAWLGDMLVDNLRKIGLVKDTPLLFAGGCALNIKWNSALRNEFGRVWVPPWPNDAGSAIGAAAHLYHTYTGGWKVNWSVYSGKPVTARVPAILHQWRVQALEAGRLGVWLAQNPHMAVVAIHGNAELGPRALGHRSILASPVNVEMKEFLNRIKGREPFRPVAPICLEHEAGKWFRPGTPDPYMLFDHECDPITKQYAPAVVHVDNTARLQTITAAQCPTTADIVYGHFSAVGVPILCNTSANFNGSGFFPDVPSAEKWINQQNDADRQRIAIWNGTALYTR